MIQNSENIIIFYKVIKALYALYPKFKDSVKMPNFMKSNMHFCFQKSELELYSHNSCIDIGIFLQFWQHNMGTKLSIFLY